MYIYYEWIWMLSISVNCFQTIINITILSICIVITNIIIWSLRVWLLSIKMVIIVYCQYHYLRLSVSAFNSFISISIYIQNSYLKYINIYSIISVFLFNAKSVSIPVSEYLHVSIVSVFYLYHTSMYIYICIWIYINLSRSVRSQY